jgi:nicotinate dehydrogenase subunit B
MKSAALDRREFFRQSGALVVGFTLASAGLAQQLAPRPQLPGSLSNNRMLDGWLRINADGTVTVFTGKVELGQGILTALAQIAAEELDIAYERVEMISADTSRSPDEGMTAGSQSVENSGTALRFAAAEAREMLLQLAAARLGVHADKLAVSDGTVSAGATQATYWELVKSVDLKREATARARPKSPASHRIVGKSIKRRDIPKKVTGGAAYVQDIRLPGMLFGRVVRPAAPGARLENCDEAAVRAMPGVVAVVRDGSFLAVAAEREEQAIKAANALRTSAKWTAGTALPPQGSALFEHLQNLPARDSVVNSKVGAPSAGGPVTTIEAKYTRPYQCHASIGPSCAVAQVKDGKLTVWTHSQGVYPLRQHLARVMRMSDASIIAVHVEGSGCYGHNGADDVACDASLVARATGGRPVKLQWMREDEFGWEPYGSAMVMKLQARVDASGQVVDWQHETWSHPHSTRPGGAGSNLLAGWDIANPVPMGAPINGAQPAGAADRNAVPLYVFPNQRIILHYLQEMPLRTSALRTLGAYANVFALESFIDELAVAANVDPVEFRLRHMKDPRARGYRGGGRQSGLASRPQRRRRARSRHRLRAVQESRRVCRGGRGRRGRPAHRQYASRQNGSGSRRGAHHQSRRRSQPDRGRHHPVDELVAQGIGPLRRASRANAVVGRLSYPHVFRSPGGRRRIAQPARRAIARHRRRLAGPDRRGDCERDRQRDRHAPARSAVHARQSESGARLTH